MEQTEVRNILLGPAFSPKVEDIPTPPLLLAQGIPDGTLRLVSMSAEERYDVLTSLDKHPVVNSSLLIAATLRMRDSGAADGKGTYVFGKLNEQGVSVPNPVDVLVLSKQDSELWEVLAGIVKPFTRIGNEAAAIDAAKNDSGTTPSSTGGTGSPSTSDFPPSENANGVSETPIS